MRGIPTAFRGCERWGAAERRCSARCHIDCDQRHRQSDPSQAAARGRWQGRSRAETGMRGVMIRMLGTRDIDGLRRVRRRGRAECRARCGQQHQPTRRESPAIHVLDVSRREVFFQTHSGGARGPGDMLSQARVYRVGCGARGLCGSWSLPAHCAATGACTRAAEREIACLFSARRGPALGALRAARVQRGRLTGRGRPRGPPAVCGGGRVCREPCADYETRPVTQATVCRKPWRIKSHSQIPRATWMAVIVWHTMISSPSHSRRATP